MNLKKIEEIIQQSENLDVLYVEDNIDARTHTLEVLKDFFASVDTAVDGKEAYEMLQKIDYDLLITDINMPKINGIDLITKLRQHNEHISVLVLSAYNEPTYFIETIKLGIDGYLLKPLDISQFVDSIYRTVHRIQISKENSQYKASLVELVKKKTQELKHTYHYDQLTNLPNRLSLEQSIESDNQESIIVLDINKFSTINNLYGVKIGDRILHDIAALLKSILPKNYKMYRLSGDQFACLSHINQELKEYQMTAQSILDTLTSFPIKIIIDEHEIEINISATISIVNQNSEHRLLEYADMALNYAKKTHQSIIVYSKEISLEEQYKKELNAIKLVKHALEEDRLVPFFQPIIKTSGETTYECLARIIAKDGKIISPFFFIDGVKKTKYYAELTRVMIKKAFDVFENTATSFSINLSYEDISNESIITYIKELIDTQNMAKNLILEIVESESIDNFELIKNFIAQMKGLGVRIALDDFGSGYSNFSYLMELKPDYIKIDGSLIKDIDTNKESYIITKTISNFSKELNIEVIAEYIHSKEVHEKAKELNIVGFQGFYLGEPKQEITKD
ncbi:MAG: EAL domain-containing protein [Campylobacterota bacterium]|nr:EAL domain-containing protein [Campylobacterota bacterium]